MHTELDLFETHSHARNQKPCMSTTTLLQTSMQASRTQALIRISFAKISTICYFKELQIDSCCDGIVHCYTTAR
jgi:hypothetical protein